MHDGFIEVWFRQRVASMWRAIFLEWAPQGWGAKRRWGKQCFGDTPGSNLGPPSFMRCPRRSAVPPGMGAESSVVTRGLFGWRGPASKPASATYWVTCSRWLLNHRRLSWLPNGDSRSHLVLLLWEMTVHIRGIAHCLVHSKDLKSVSSF